MDASVSSLVDGSSERSIAMTQYGLKCDGTTYILENRRVRLHGACHEHAECGDKMDTAEGRRMPYISLFLFLALLSLVPPLLDLAGMAEGRTY